MYDLIVIGGGPGGYHGAIHGAQEGLKTALIEQNRLGGVCLQEGCIPTKSLVHSGEILRICANAGSFGIDVDSFNVNWQAVQNRKDKVIHQLTKGLEQLMAPKGVAVIQGKATLTGRSTGSLKEVAVELNRGGQTTLTGKNIIIATGSIPWVPPIPGSDLQGVIGSREALELPAIPGKLLIIGGGVIGAEFAGIYSAFGSQVTIVEFLPQIMSSMDGEIARRMAAELKRSKVRILTGSQVTKISKSGEQLAAAIKTGDKQETIIADNILTATGRRPNLRGLELEKAGIEYSEKTGIKTDRYLRTSAEGIYAIGDVAGNFLLAHVASAEGITAVDNILGGSREMDYRAVPSAVFTHPEAAGAGLTEEEAGEKGIPCKTTKFMLGSNSRAVTMGDNRGMVKIITTVPEDIIIGAHIIGPNASELIHELTLAISMSATAQEVARTIHAHPTLSEAIMETAQGVFGKFTHML